MYVGVSRRLCQIQRQLQLHTMLSHEGPSETLKRKIAELQQMRKSKKNLKIKKDQFIVEVPESKSYLDTASLPMILTVVGISLFAKLLMMHDDSRSQELIERKIKNAPAGQGTVRMLSHEEWEEIREVRPRTPFESKLAHPNARIRTGEQLRKIDQLQSTFHQWERIPSNTGEQVNLRRKLLALCEGIGWQVDSLGKAIAVQARNPACYGIDEVEVEKRRKWISTAHTQVSAVTKAVEVVKESNGTGITSVNGMHRELMRLQNSHQTDRSNQYTAQDGENFIASESDRQFLLIKQQDTELKEVSAGVARIGGVGLTIHKVFLGQEKIKDDLGTELSSSHHKRTRHEAHAPTSKDGLDRNINKNAAAVAIESKPSSSNSAQPSSADIMDALQRILRHQDTILRSQDTITTHLAQINSRLDRLESRGPPPGYH